MFKFRENLTPLSQVMTPASGVGHILRNSKKSRFFGKKSTFGAKTGQKATNLGQIVLKI